MDHVRIKSVMKALGIRKINHGASLGGLKGWLKTSGKRLVSYSPINGEPLATIIQASGTDYETILTKAGQSFDRFKQIPAPKRGEIVREIADAIRRNKEPLGALITFETGKIIAEGLGEVQEMIDIADFSVGLSRQLYGLTMHSERPHHRMYEQWHPLGVVGIITAFNFPAAVWSWNALIASVCGNTVIFKPSSKTPLTAIAIQNIIAPVVDRYDLEGVFNLIIGDRRHVGDRMLEDRRIPLISVTGSTGMGKKVATTVAARFGRSLLELGGNNAIIVTEEADLDMAIRASLFSALGTAGQRCTSTRRIIVHASIKERFVKALVDAYRQIRIHDPSDQKTLMGPLIDHEAVKNMMNAVEAAVRQGGRLIYGGTPLIIEGFENGSYIIPAIVEAENHYPVVQEETFAPIVYIIEYNDFDEALKLHNDVPQGLSSAIFTRSIRYQERFLSQSGSDCGIANVNMGTSGAEIGGAFGGEKETGGGRESGSDAWKNYMRRQTVTINFGEDLPLSQGILFDFSGEKNE